MLLTHEPALLADTWGRLFFSRLRVYVRRPGNSMTTRRIYIHTHARIQLSGLCGRYIGRQSAAQPIIKSNKQQHQIPPPPPTTTTHAPFLLFLWEETQRVEKLYRSTARVPWGVQRRILLFFLPLKKNEIDTQHQAQSFSIPNSRCLCALCRPNTRERERESQSSAK
jgi:hypothetical protein